MLAIVKSSTSLRQTLLYNESKLKAGQATLLDAHNFWQEKEDLSLADLLHRFKNLTALNERSKANTLHISLNFHPMDDLSDKKMTKIAAEFMKGIDFNDQPWLVYRHHDASHPHMHIVTTNIRPDGSRIKNDKRAPTQLMHLCQKIETTHCLTHAQANDLAIYRSESDEPLEKLQYGQVSTKQGIARVLDTLLDKYSYTSLDHLNAILSLYRVRADRGSIHGAMYQNHGLLYRMIDHEGKKLGAPIKASAFDCKATLKDLEQRFALNVAKEAEAIERVSMEVYFCSHHSNCESLEEYRERLSREYISLVIPAFFERPTRKQPANPSQSPLPPIDDGHGFFFIDLRSRTILRDTQLDAKCSAADILKGLKLDAAIPALINEQKLTPSKSDTRLLQSPDPQKARNALLRLTPQHDRYIQKQQAQRRAHRLRPGF